MGTNIEGWKTYLAGAISIMAGIVGLYFHVTKPESPLAMQPEAAWAMISGGLGIIGLGHKLDKNTAAVKEAGAKTESKVQEVVNNTK